MKLGAGALWMEQYLSVLSVNGPFLSDTSYCMVVLFAIFKSSFKKLF